jgi:hypothetical protein
MSSEQSKIVPISCKWNWHLDISTTQQYYFSIFVLVTNLLIVYVDGSLWFGVY